MTLIRPLSLAFLILSAQVWAEPSNMQPGMWEITTEMDMPGMPVKMPAHTMHHCYTAEDLNQSENVVPQSGNGDCKITGYRLNQYIPVRF